MNARDFDDDDDARDLVRAEVPAATTGPEALAHLLSQSNREAAANRAQARELIKALEGVQRSQEYLGTALREERAKSRWLLVLLLVAPLAVAAAVWQVAGRMDDVKTDLSDRLARFAADAETSRANDVTKFHDTRVTELAADLDSLHRDLNSSRDALAAERKHVAERETALASAENRTDGARTEIGALEFEVRAAKSKAGAEQARATALENRIRELESQLDARTKASALPAKAPTASAGTAPSAFGPDAARPVVAAPSAAPAPSSAASTPVNAVRPAGDAAAIEKTRAMLNTLLDQSADTVRYRIAVLGGLDGKSLTGVTLVGSDQAGSVVRTIHADRAEITVDPASGSVVIHCFGGKLVVGAIEAPFYGGSYGLVVRGDAAKWMKSGLDFVK